MAGAAVEATQLLLNAQSPDGAVRAAAEEQLRQAETQNFTTYVATLSTELANNAKPADSRRLAGLLLKNALDAKEDSRKKELHARWIALDPTLKQHVRDATLATLHSDVDVVRHTAAMVIAKISAADLPRNEWPHLITTLLNNMGAQPQVTGTRQATLQAMGYVCEEMGQISDVVLTPEQINMLLTAIVAGMTPTEPNESRLAATVALSNAIEFANHNFQNDNERNVIMQVVCEGTKSTDERIRVASFECLHDIAHFYYGKLPAYMTEIYNLTVRAIKEDKEEVALQAIEFWSTICDTEYDLIEEPDEDEPCHKFIEAAAQHLVPILLELLLKQEEGQEQDDTAWNLATAGGACLQLVSRVIRNNVVPMVMPFIHANIGKNAAPTDWRAREAATCAFGLILEGPDPKAFTEIVTQALGFLLQAMRDPHPHVRDTTAWTIGRIFECLHAEDIEPRLITRETLPPIMGVLVESLKDEAFIAYRVCCAISALAIGFTGSSETTSPMSPFFKDTIGALLQCAQRYATYEHSKIQIAAFEAINDLVRSASHDTLDTVSQLINVVLPEIHKTFEAPAPSAEARERQAEVQGQLCGVLTCILHKLSEQDMSKALVLPYADQIMETLLRIFQFRSATVHEEAMLAVGAFTYALGRNFTKYLQQFYPYLKMGLTNYQEWQVCLSTVGVLGDVCRNVEEQILPVCDEVMSLLIQNLGREDVHRLIKPQILAAFGDVAMHINEKFEKYLEAVLRVLKQAMQLSVHQAQSGDVDFVEYNNTLRHGIIDAYSGVIQGMGPAKCEQYLRPEVTDLLAFVASIGNEQDVDEDVARSAVSLLGDLCSVLPGLAPQLVLHKSAWDKLVKMFEETSGDSTDTSDAVQWAIGQIQATMAGR